MTHHRIHQLAAAFIAISIVSALQLDRCHAEDQSKTKGDLEIRARVEGLIEQLGDPSYARRTRARGELKRLGLIAFDALHEAQLSDNREIATVARYLVESLHVSWSTENDSEDVRHILEEYGNANEVERKSRMDRLAALPDRAGLAALCRLVRFETKLRLSRLASLLIMRQGPAESKEVRRRNASVILDSLGSNTRESTQWLQLYVKDLLNDGLDLEGWRAFIQAERDRVAGHTTKHTDELTVLELYRICSVRAQRIGMTEQALELALESLDLVDGRLQPLRNATSWALDHEMWPVILHLHKREPVDFRKDAWLLYAAAEAFSETGSPEKGKELVVEALELAPISPLDEDGKSSMSADAREQAVRWHTEVAESLLGRGRFAWAEREYRYVIDRCPVETPSAADARLQLAFMLGDMEQHRAASDVLEPAVTRMRKDGDFRRQVEREVGAMKKFESRMHLYAARAKFASDEIEAARSSIRKSVEADSTDGDVLIEMFRLPGNDQWKKEVRIAIRNAVTEFETNIRNNERILQAGGPQGGNFGQLISYYCNQYAWLVCNTEGDFQKALAYSKRSLELKPNSPSLTDTLSHCYFAVGDIDAAVRTQRAAHAMEPHSPPIKKQLDFFIAKQAERDAAPDQ